MKWMLGAILVLGLTATAVAQTASPAPATRDNTTPAAPSAQAAPSTQANPSAPIGKRAACQAAAQGMKGQERHDQMQLCMAQAHLDCVKQAIDQKVVGSQRRDFMKTCMGGG
jgi:hypothetical protein